MRIDFYQLSRDPVETVATMLARKVRETGTRLLIVSSDAAQRARIADALWDADGAFLANGSVNEPHATRQPILLAADCTRQNKADIVLLADGEWRDDAAGFERALLVFSDATIAAARSLWRQMGETEGMERHFWKQDGGRWTKAA